MICRMAAGALSGLQNSAWPEGCAYALPDGGSRLIRPTKQCMAGGVCRCSAGWRLAPYPAYKSGDGVS